MAQKSMRAGGQLRYYTARTQRGRTYLKSATHSTRISTSCAKIIISKIPTDTLELPQSSAAWFQLLQVPIITIPLATLQSS